MRIRPRDLSDELYNENFSCLILTENHHISDPDTSEFVNLNYIPCLIRNFNHAVLSFICDKLSLTTSHLSWEFDENIVYSEYNNMWDLNLECIKKNKKINEISYDEIQKCLKSFPLLDPVYRFVLLLILMKTKTLECVYRSILHSKDSLVSNFF